MKIFGYFKLKKELNLTSDCLNKKYDFQISQYKGNILTPILIENFKTNKNYLHTKLLPPKNEFDIYDKTLDWGTPSIWPIGDSGVSTLKIELNIDDDFSNDKKLKLQQEINNWINRFQENLFAYDYNIDSPNLTVNTSIASNFKFFTFNNNKCFNEYFENTNVLINLHPSNALTESEFRDVINVTSLNKKLILEYQLLKNANTELINNNYRKSVLDSATALEVSITNAIRRDLEVNEEILPHILKKYNGLRQKRELLKLTNNTLPSPSPSLDYENGIENLRNNAIHSGKIPTEIEASNAYRIAKEAINSLTINKYE
ncbi:hypothetical protein [Geminocystis herdmanii]|uniref:hypothetical protein n=1 Tax=Geminocystis herdmanii TaxID=669359 RepID=UPI000348B3C5|nr:hypothetical protein [Geminocystis herdmanii]